MRKFLSLFPVLRLYGVLVFAQNRVVSGKITDDSGNPAVDFAGSVSASNVGTFPEMQSIFG